MEEPLLQLLCAPLCEKLLKMVLSHFKKLRAQGILLVSFAIQDAFISPVRHMVVVFTDRTNILSTIFSPGPSGHHTSYIFIPSPLKVDKCKENLRSSTTSGLIEI